MKKYDKPFLTYEEQLEKLRKDNNFKIDIDIARDIDFLRTISYYDLINGYKEHFMKEEKFNDEISLSKLFIFNFTDKKFQNILFLQSIYVENIFKTKLAYLISKTRGVDYPQYLNKDMYHSPTPKRELKLKITLEDMVFVCEKSSDNPTKYYRENHNHIPPWILLKNVKFNTVIDLFSFLKKEEKLAIIGEYRWFKSDEISDDDKIELFKNMISIVRKFRNKIAHNYKTLGITLDEKTGLYLNKINSILSYNLLSKGDIKKRRGEKDLFAMIISLFFLSEPTQLKFLFIEELKKIKAEVSEEYFKICNIPENVVERLEEITKMF